MIKFLIDNALSPFFAEALQKAGYDTVHVRQMSLQSASDETIFEIAEQEGRVIISTDTDFGTILTLRKKLKPSVVLFRKLSQRRPEQQIKIFLTNLPDFIEELDQGCIVVIEEKRIRIRRLPVSED